MAIPNADALINNYPQGTSAEVKAKIGGKVNADWITNTCAIRLSRSMNYSGVAIPRGPGVKESGLHTVSGGDQKQYAYRVNEFNSWLRNKYGPPTLTYKGGPFSAPPTGLFGKKGIICFFDCGWSDAMGHLDLWNVDKVVNSAYFNKAKQIYLWTSPTAEFPCTKIAKQVTNVRAGPSTSAPVLGQIAAGEAVTALGKNGMFIRIGDKMFAWMANFKDPA